MFGKHFSRFLSGSLSRVLTASLAVGMVALSGASALAQDRVELVMPMIAFASEIEGWRAAVDEANAILAPQNIAIRFEEVPVTSWDEYYQKITAMQAAGQPLDLGRLAESQMPIAIEREQVVDLTDWIQSDLDMTQYFESTFRSAAYQDERYYGLPSGVYYLLLYYNKDMFDAAGLEYPSSDWENAITFDQVREYARQLTSGEGANKVFGFAGGPYMAFIGMYAASGGGNNVFTEDGACALTSPESLRVYEWFDAMLRTDQSQPTPNDTAVISAWDMFKSGRIGMVVDGTWFFGSAKNDITDFNVGLAAVPSADGQAITSAFVDSWVIWEGTQYPDQAWQALKAIYSAESFKALAEAGVGGVPIHRGVVEDPELDLIGGQFDENDRAAFLGGLENTLAVPYNEYYNEIDVKINGEMGDWLLGNMTAQQFAERSCEIMQSVTGQ
jgi:multiple sugar transport system substrate-binding protein